jgi:eukaryotic-like serine/threonine-protein kinase
LESSTSTQERELAEGQIIGTYRVLRQVGAGGFGRVYEVEALDSGERFAVKVGRRPALEGRMAREARLAALLKSPHSVRVFGFELMDDRSPLIVMEFLRGISLREYLAMRGRVEPALALRWACELAEALREAHAIGLVHRDLKPSNLFLAETGHGVELKLLDFGLARAWASWGEPSVTDSQMVLGSPAYMSPEQIRSHNVTPQSDIWSFGIVLHEMLAGTRPFNSGSNPGLLAAIAADAPASLQRDCPGLSPAIYGIVERCLSKSPQERFRDARELHCALASARSRDFQRPRRAEEPTTATLSAQREPPSPRHRRRQLYAIVLCMATLGGVLWRWRGTPDTGAEASSRVQIAEPGATARTPRALHPAVVRQGSANSAALRSLDASDAAQPGRQTQGPPASSGRPMASTASPEPTLALPTAKRESSNRAAKADPRRPDAAPPQRATSQPSPAFFAAPDF